MINLPFNIEFELAAIAIFIITIVYTYSGKNLPNFINRIYRFMLSVAFLAAVMDIVTVFLIAYSDTVSVRVNYIINYLYLLLQNMLTPIWFLYVFSLTEEKDKSWKTYLYSMPALVIIISFIITPFTKFIFYFDENKMYQHGAGMLVLYACSILYLLLSLIITIRYQKNLNKNQRIAIAFFVCSAILAVILQAVLSGVLLTGFASALSCLIMYISLQNPEEQLDYTTGTFNRTAAITMISDYLKQKQSFRMIVLAIDQFRYVNETYGFETGDALLRSISKYLNNIVPNCEYRLDGDNIAVIFEEEVISMETMIENIRQKFLREWVVADESIRLSTCICCISCPEDAQTVSEVLDTINNTIADAKEIGYGTIIYASEHVENREKKISELEEQKKLLENISKEAEIARLEAEKADRTKSIFLANMSHEIRTPMNAILGMTELVLRDNVSNQVRDNMENIKGAGESLLALINDILDISKIESGKLEIVNDHYHLSSIIHDIANMICARMADKELEFTIDIDNKLPDELLGDELRIRQILLNLLTNAVKFTPTGYIGLKIYGEIKEDSVNLHIEVMDTGFGIKEEDKERLFESFARFDGIKTRQIEGTGLGLAICKQLLTLMGGDIHFESEYGVGSVFYVDLEQKIFNHNAMIEISNRKLLKILVIVDNEEDKQIMNTLKNFGITATYEVQSASVWMLLQDVKFSHVFMSYQTYSNQKQAADKICMNTKVVVITKYGQYIESIGFLSAIQKPVYCLNVGEALNGTLQTRIRKTVHETFIAPEAKILVVDDNAVNLKVVEGLLKPYQMQITKALSGKECLALLDLVSYDLIFLDHMMPDMDGIETLEKIRMKNGDYYKKVRIVALTANAIRGIREMFIEKGFNDYISKPIDIRRLDEVLKNNLPKERIQPENVQRNIQKEVFPYDLPFVNTKKGVENCSGSVELYWELLSTLMYEGRVKLHLMKEYIQTDNIKSYMVETHALKSVAASIGAMKLSALARKHEEASKEGDFVFIQSKGGELFSMYEQLLTEIESILAFHKQKEVPVDKKEISMADKMERLISSRDKTEDYEDEEALQDIQKLMQFMLSETEQEELTKAEHALKGLNYSAAISILNQQIQELENNHKGEQYDKTRV